MTALIMNPAMGNDPVGGDLGHKQNHHHLMGMEVPGYPQMEHHMDPHHQGMFQNPNPGHHYGSYMFAPNQGQMFDPHGMYTDLQSPSQISDPSLSPSPPPPPRIYKPCVVCSDKSSGYHYGVSSCEGCKGFFRRSVQKNMQYTCHKDKNCPINKVTRNRCQYCRLQKCFAMGMSKEAVRNDRNKKRKPKGENSNSSENLDELTEEEQSLLQEILEAHKQTYQEDDDSSVNSPVSSVALLASQLGTRKEDSQDVSKDSSEKEKEQTQENGLPVKLEPMDDARDRAGTENNKEENKKELTSEHLMLWERITELSSRGIIKIVEFAKKIPGFVTLSTSDQITLLKAACLEIMVLRLSSRYDTEQDTLMFSGGARVTKEQLKSGGFGSLTDTIFNFARSLKEIDLDEMEYAALSSICLISGDRSGLEDSEKIEQMQEPILESLKHYVRSRRKDQPHVYAKMLMKITDLRSISVKGAARVLNLHSKRTEELSPLVREMFKRPENVEFPISKENLVEDRPTKELNFPL